MSFKENLLIKIAIDRMAEKVIASIGPPGGESRVDKETMRKLLVLSGYQPRKERDLELFMQDKTNSMQKILVLDNDLPLYNTTADDVVLRKSPTIKEMLSIRNAIKILNDSDVIVSKKEDSVRFFQKEGIALLDLSFNEADLREIGKDGMVSLEKGHTNGVVQTLELFSEILGYKIPPGMLRISNHFITSRSVQEPGKETVYGPFVIYSMIHNTIKLFEDKFNAYEKDKIELLHMTASGRIKASMEGPPVFEYLKNSALLKKRLPAELS
jgi:hypothetical protein